MFSVTIPPSTAAAALKALEIFKSTPELHLGLKSNIKHFVGGLRSLGFQVNPNHESAVIPVVIGDEKKLTIMSEYFKDAGVFVVPVVYPVVSRKSCRFRFTLMATHTIADLDFVLFVIEQALNAAGLDPKSIGTDAPAGTKQVA